ncbi:hypothetical protein PVL29_009055 [Vitis rotundifolia]|uniref:Flavin-containing monooxygenase n=1 Tax=Vitis rotundifolia TaxID=103349 RepID=A0AA39DU76_VITRO|nr:hypothetical protein PVL29_009055 [Vitis rotundifolia]
MEKTLRISDHDDFFSRRCVWVNGPLIVGAGPSGLAVGACLKEQGVPFVVLERAECIASLWQKRTYDRLKLHLPKQFCQLPKMPFPEAFPEYPTKKQFIEYLESYAKRFEINPRFNECVQSAKYDETCGLWRVRTVSTNATTGAHSEVEYICRWLVVATGENAECVVPNIEGLGAFGGNVMLASEYKSGETFRGKRVLVVGCGNSGMESLSTSATTMQHQPWLDSNGVVFLFSHFQVHVLPREVFRKSTFELATLMMKWLPLWLVDKLMLILAWLVFGDIEKYGLKRPSMEPLELKNTQGKTPALDIGALEKIRSGDIKVVPGIKRFFPDSVELVNGEKLENRFSRACHRIPQQCPFLAKGSFVKYSRQGLSSGIKVSEFLKIKFFSIPINFNP